MGSGNKGHYNGTHGSSAYAPHKPAQLHKKLSTWAKRVANQLESTSKRQRDLFNVACIVYDISTGKRYYGRNNGIQRNNEPKNEILFGNKTQTGLLPTKSLNRYRIGNCAEVDAVNKALNHGAKLKNLYMTTIDTTKNNFGKLKEACKNCTYTFKGKIRINYAGWKSLEGDNKND